MHPSSPYKTISSDSQTRHGTTNKKAKHRNRLPNRQSQDRQYEDYNEQQMPERQQPRHQDEKAKHQQQQRVYRKNYHLHSLNEQIDQLKNLKNWQIHNRKYRAASATQKNIKKTQGEAKLYCLKRLSYDHYQEKQNIKKAHKLQMHKFQRVWKGMFDFVQQKKNAKIAKWQRQQEKQYYQLRMDLTHRYHSMRSHSRQLIDLEDQERGLVKMGRFQDLKYLKAEKIKLKKKLEGKKNKQFKHIVKLEDEKFRKTQTKRYTSLMIRLEEQKKDYKRKYNRDQVRLKQKYKNVISQLKHEQTVEMNQLLGKSIF